jgi:hypothetical protein
MDMTVPALYAVWFRDRVRPEYEGIMTAGGANEISTRSPATVFTSYTEALAAAERISFRQETKILEWRLVVEPSDVKFRTVM